MSKGLEFNIDKPGFPVTIGGVELWFDNSYENLVKFFEAREIIQKKEFEVGEKLKKYEDINEDTMDFDTGKQILEIKKEYISAYYDNIFGDGSFEKIYDKYPYISELEALLPALDEAIGKEVAEREEKRMKVAETQLSEIDKKRTKKK